MSRDAAQWDALLRAAQRIDRAAASSGAGGKTPAAIEFDGGADAAMAAIAARTVLRGRLYGRNGVLWFSARSWRADAKRDAIAVVKEQKRAPLPPFVPQASRELADCVRRAVGAAAGLSVTSVPCGHSRRSDCAGAQLAQAVALEIGAEYRARFADRFVSGSSHPREFAKLASARVIDATPCGLIVVVDDVATSGWHMEDALMALRGRGLPALGVAWISGTVAS